MFKKVLFSLIVACMLGGVGLILTNNNASANYVEIEEHSWRGHYIVLFDNVCLWSEAGGVTAEVNISAQSDTADTNYPRSRR